MKATKEGQYRKKVTGNIVYRYIVSGTAEELALYKKAAGENYRENDKGQPFFFTTKVLAKNLDLVATRDMSSIFADTSETDNLINLVNQNTGKVADALAQIVAQKLVDSISGRQASAPVAVSAPAAAETLES